MPLQVTVLTQQFAYVLCTKSQLCVRKKRNH